MRLKGIILFFIIILFSCKTLPGQDFDGDSVYYTPIPKSYGLSKKNKTVRHTNFQDTILIRRHVYFLSLQTGALVGCSSCSDGKDVSFTFSFVNGITIGEKIRAGIGLGFDSYVGWQTLPAFTSLSWDVFGNKDRNALFIQFTYGISKGWNQKSYQGYGFERAEGGRMFAPQLGYRMKYRDLNLSLAVGAKLQRVFSFYEYPTGNWVNGENQPGTSKSTIKQDMSRLMITMAVGWR